MVKKTNTIKKMTRHQKQDQHLLKVLDNIIRTNPNVESTLAEHFTIKVLGDDLDEMLNNLVNTIQVLNLRTYKVLPQNCTGDDKDKNVHILMHTPNLVDEMQRLGTFTVP